MAESFAGRFRRVEPRRAAAGFVTGLLADLEIKTCWQVAEQAGHARPDAMQRLLYRAKWDADAVRDDLRQVVVDRLGDPDGVLVVDETGDVKKGVHTPSASSVSTPVPLGGSRTPRSATDQFRIGAATARRAQHPTVRHLRKVVVVPSSQLRMFTFQEPELNALRRARVAERR